MGIDLKLPPNKSFNLKGSTEEYSYNCPWDKYTGIQFSVGKGEPPFRLKTYDKKSKKKLYSHSFFTLKKIAKDCPEVTHFSNGLNCNSRDTVIMDIDSYDPKKHEYGYKKNKNKLCLKAEHYLKILAVLELPFPQIILKKDNDPYSFQLHWYFWGIWDKIQEPLETRPAWQLQEKMNLFLEADKGFQGPAIRFPNFEVFEGYKNATYKAIMLKNSQIYKFDYLFEKFNQKNVCDSFDILFSFNEKYNKCKLPIDSFNIDLYFKGFKEWINEYNSPSSLSSPSNCIRSGKEKESKKPINPTPIASVGCSAVENFIPAVFKENVGVGYQVYMFIRRNWWNNLENLTEAEQVKTIQEMMLNNKIVSAIKSKFAYKIVDSIDKHKKLVSSGKFVNRSTPGTFITKNQHNTYAYKLIKNIAHSHDAPRSRLKYSIKVVNACKSLICAFGLLNGDECNEILKLRKNKSQCRFVAYLNKLYKKYDLNDADLEDLTSREPCHEA
jgi:hypothetical protein